MVMETMDSNESVDMKNTKRVVMTTIMLTAMVTETNQKVLYGDNNVAKY